jgi:signal peptidase
MNPKLKTALKITSNTLLALVIILAILLVGVRIFGIDILTVLSPSMEPKYPTGSLIYLVDVDPAKLEVEDVITYRISEKTTATHRIKEIIPDEDDPSIVRFRTKGDNNDDYDGSLVEFEQVEGKVIFCIPLLGHLAMYIQRPPGLYIAIGTALAIIFFVMVVDTVTDDKKSKNKNEHKGESDNEKI